jgi:hypothetical protein
MKENKIEFKISKNEDVDKFEQANYDNIDHLHIDSSEGYIDNEKLIKVFERLSTTKQDRKFHLDLKKLKLEMVLINKLLNCFGKWHELVNLHFHFREVRFDEETFKRLMEGITKLNNLTKIHLLLESCEINTTMANYIEQSLKKLPKLNNVRLDLTNNKLNEKDVANLKKLVNSYSSNEMTL